MSYDSPLVHPNGFINIRLSKSKTPPSKPSEAALENVKIRRKAEDYQYKKDNDNWDALDLFEEIDSIGESE